MRQTPAIPANCQWAVFLRNHDELTLEMVTSAERDYLWETYASDRRARINLGIRRRLAPLLQRDRRRIELMNGLLLSMPGTPVIYYGDEIGMGDNIHLGDRDGVRTPMQWSVDRNGGFSRADPAALVLPPIMDPIYGFPAVNVESQARDQHSLLNWMRTMLAVRRQHRAFGRGTQRFIYPDNRKVLAYLREYGDETGEETLLCVSNLSRTAQAVELDLSAYVGRTPIDIVGGATFPRIGQLSYLLTMPPYAFYWFMLATESAVSSGHTPAPEMLPEFATIVLRREVEEVLQPTGRAILEREALPMYLQKRRWFASKGERMGGVRIAYSAKLGEGLTASLLCELEVDVGGRTEHYALPLGACRDDEASALAQQLAVTRLRRVANVGYLTDAFALDSFTHNVIDALLAGRELPAGSGKLVFRRNPALEAMQLGETWDIHRLSAEQSNSSLIVSEQVVLKLVRKVLAGRHPEAEMTGYLTARGFANIAPLLGEVIRIDEQDIPHTIMLAQGFVRNQGDAWIWTLDYLKRVSGDLAAEDDQSAYEDALSGYLALAAAIGRRLAEMHAVLSEETDDEAFRPLLADAAAVRVWADGVEEQIGLALAACQRVTEWPSDEARVLAESFAAQADRLCEAARHLAADAAGLALQTRVHGDFHLGQVLVTPGDATLIDFEGEPAKTMEQRRAKSSPLRDVAGMLRSFDYAAASALAGRAPGSEQAAERQHVLVEHFRQCASRVFLDAYRKVLHEAPRSWVNARAEQSLLDMFLLEKAAYEVRYEATNRPSWIGIPLAGLARVADRILVEAHEHV
jgi:maltose alpha-D-glucosyltransferase/alpha-amylase